jgi:hypothetical protein
VIAPAHHTYAAFQAGKEPSLKLTLSKTHDRRRRTADLSSRLRLSHYGLTISAAAVSGSMLAASAMPARYSSVSVSGGVRFRS